MLLQTLPQGFDPSIAAELEELGFSVSQTPEFLGVPLFETDSLLHLAIRFAFNLLISWIIVRGFYFRRGGQRQYVLTFMLFSSAMFLLLFLMESVSLQIGFTLGLFAIFGMIRYRTETVPVREMTYLFVIIAMSVINGISLEISYAELVLANLLIIALIWACEGVRGKHPTYNKVIHYDRIELIKPERRGELVADLENRLGCKVVKLEIGHVDFLKDAAYIRIWYKAEDGEPSTIGDVTKYKGNA